MTALAITAFLSSSVAPAAAQGTEAAAPFSLLQRQQGDPSPAADPQNAVGEKRCDVTDIPNGNDFEEYRSGLVRASWIGQEAELEARLVKALNDQGFTYELDDDDTHFSCWTSFLETGEFGRGEMKGFVALEISYIRDQGASSGVNFVVRYLACEKKKLADPRPSDDPEIRSAAREAVSRLIEAVE